MTFSQFAGTAIVPTLARVVLCTAFITAGAVKLFNQSDFNAEQTTTLVNELGVDVEIKTAAPPVGGNVSIQDWTITPAAFMQDEPQADDPPADAPNGEAEQDDPTDEQPEVEVLIPAQKAPPVLPADDDDAKAGEDESEIEPVALLGESRARSMHNVTLLLHSNDIPYPVAMSWIAALTEFVGGILLAIGLFSRIWGMGLAIAMAMAFYLTTMSPYFELGPLTVAGQGDHTLFNTVFSQLGLGVLALGIFLTGPGPLSLDRLIFGAKARKHEDDITIDP